MKKNRSVIGSYILGYIVNDLIEHGYKREDIGVSLLASGASILAVQDKQLLRDVINAISVDL